MSWSEPEFTIGRDYLLEKVSPSVYVVVCQRCEWTMSMVGFSRLQAWQEIEAHLAVCLG